MLLYRAQLREEAARVVAVAVRRRGRRPLFRIIVRYAGADGRMLVDRGQVWADLAVGVRLTVAGYQQSGAELWVTLERVAASKPGDDDDDGLAVADRFDLPIGVQAWGVTAVQGAAIDLQLVCRCRGGSLLVRGTLRLVVETPGAALRLRIPFCRVMAVAAAAGLQWRVLAGVSGLQLRVEPGGRVEGAAAVAVRCEGRPRGAGSGEGSGGEAGEGPGQVRPVLAKVRELSGRVVRVGAEPAGDGTAVVRGLADLDLYWFDAEGLSRWTGRHVPFGALLPFDGLAPEDRLEATAVFDRLHHRVEGGAVAAHLIVTVTVTALRPQVVKLGEACYRLELIVGSGSTTVELAERLLGPPGPAAGGFGGTAAAGGLQAATGGFRVVRGALPLPGPARGWQAVEAHLSTLDVPPPTGARAGRWTVQAAVSATPAGEPPYPAPLKAAVSGTVPLGVGQLLTVVPMLEQVDATGLRLCTTLAWGPALPAPAALGSLPAPAAPDWTPGAVVSGAISLPGPVRSVVAAGSEADGLWVRVWALVALEPRGLALVSGRLDLPWPGHPLRLTAIPTLDADQWQLQIRLDHAVSIS